MDDTDIIDSAPDEPGDIPAPPRHPVRAVIGTLALSALVVGVVLVARRHDDTATAEPVPVTKEVTISHGDLTDQQSVDGTLVETDTITVVHRIDGQTTSFTSNGSSTGTSGGSSGGAAPTAPGAALSATADAVTASRTELALTLSTVALARPAVDTTLPPDTTTPVTTTPVTTTPATTTPDTSTPATTTPGTSVPSGPSTSTPGGPSTSVPSGGGAPTGGTPAATAGGATTGGSTTGATSSGTATQVVTGVAATNDSIQSGDVLYTVESTPVVALRGALPAWRTMNSSSSDGADIAQLEAALVALGYDVDSEVTVDQEWDSATTAMVERWQRGMGVDDTGEVVLGSVVFIAHDATVAQVDVAVGDTVQDGSSVLELTGTQQQVIITVPDELQAALGPSTPVQFSSGKGVVTRLRSAEADDGTVTVQALITPDAPLDAAAGTTVKVTLTTSIATAALLVQTDALVSLVDGSYAVEVPDSDGGHHFVTVEVLGVSGNRTAISGDGIDDGMTVLAPA